MGKKIIFVISVIVNMGLCVLVFMLSNSVESMINITKSTRVERDNAEAGYDAVKSENKKLLAKTVSLEQQVISLQNELASAKRKSAGAEDDARAATGTTSGSTNMPESSSGTSQLAYARLAKARQLGKILAVIDPKQMQNGSPSPEALRQVSEVFRIMADLEMPIMESHSSNKNLLAKPELRQILTNIAIGALEELKTPLNGMQISQYERALERLSEVANKIAPEQSTATERLIAHLQNSDAITSVNKEIRDVFTDEQRRLLESETLREPFDLTPSLYDGSYVNLATSDFNDQAKASEYILHEWAGVVSASETDKEILRPIAEQYLRDYIALRNTMEGRYGKDVMDVYLKRAGAVYGPDYEDTKNTMDIEFLQLVNRYHKEISSRLGSDKASSLTSSEAQITHFPNVN